MGLFVGSSPPILKQIPALPPNYRWKFRTVGTTIIGPPTLMVLLQKKGRFFWRTLTFHPCSAPTIPCVISAANIIYDNYGGVL